MVRLRHILPLATFGYSRTLYEIEFWSILLTEANQLTKKYMKIFAQFVSSLVGGILLGIIGLMIGAFIGGNFGFPEFGGNAGYESGGVFFAIVGISLGGLLGIMVAKKIQKEQYKYTIASIAAIVTIFIGVIIFDYNMPPAVRLIILLMPSVVLTAITNWQKFSKTRS